MSLRAVKILGISITVDQKEKILEEIKKYLTQPPKAPAKPLVTHTPNPEQLVLASQKSWFAKLLNQADVTLPDGIGLVWASRVLRGTVIPQRIPGIEFMQDLVHMAAKQGVRMGLIGGRQGVAVDAFECLRKQIPALEGWAMDAPEFSRDIFDSSHTFLRSVTQKIRTTNTGLVFVGLGAPKQEQVINHIQQELHNQRVVLMSVGGSFDILSGTIQRAPLLIRLIGLEWMWRLVQEPWRWKRQLALVRFMGLILKAKFLPKSNMHAAS